MTWPLFLHNPAQMARIGFQPQGDVSPIAHLRQGAKMAIWLGEGLELRWEAGLRR